MINIDITDFSRSVGDIFLLNLDLVHNLYPEIFIVFKNQIFDVLN